MILMFSAPYILSKLKGTEAVADSMSYWTFTDIFRREWPGTFALPRRLWSAELSGTPQARVLCLSVSEPPGAMKS